MSLETLIVLFGLFCVIAALAKKHRDIRYWRGK